MVGGGKFVGYIVFQQQFSNDAIYNVGTLIAYESLRCPKTCEDAPLQKFAAYHRIILRAEDNFNPLRYIANDQQDVNMSTRLWKWFKKVNSLHLKEFKLQHWLLWHFVLMGNISNPLAMVTIDHKVPRILK